ncbi:MAG TPA: electron transfer flavoprotein subunit alpha/FixB family protein [Candidatus Scatomorpha pullistercoris]|uniref:Electron transfer flavoprotein subunit alpha/FixB family protein n=1 Tax=Candidatus Scatomorpha pullistercoris TaxID=2840929 RepID=A0A9D1G3A0_9FIRM|nr:electron transfer flavoprotein subunit alpha/FixB family protein [Candidatus Scatomorpha pullistercoris]
MEAKLSSVLVVADRRDSIEKLTSAAKRFGDNVTLAYAGKREDAVNAVKAYCFGDGNSFSFADCAEDITAIARSNEVQLVLCSPTRNGRLAAAAIAVGLGAGILSDCLSLEPEGAGFVSTRMVYGGAAIKTERAPRLPVVVCPAESCFDEATEMEPVKDIVDCEPSVCSFRLVERREKQLRSRNLGAARVVVGVGRGIGSEGNVALAKELAKSIGGEVGCTRPVAEELKWLPSELNLGISGSTIKPELYIACGISGQIQHLVGVNNARTIAAINKDENAPIFNACDIGLIADLNVVLPELIKRFSSENKLQRGG